MQKDRILLVDDEERLLTGLKRLLRATYEVESVSDPIAAVERIRNDDEYSVLMTDYKMPGMKGTDLLKEALALKPDTVRVMLTGYADLPATLQAINDGSVYRILTKPCEREDLLKCLSDASRQYRLIKSEKQLLDETLNGSIELLTDLLSLHCPVVFEKSHLYREVASFLATEIGAESIWDIEVAAMLSELGLVTLSENLLNKHLDRVELDPSEQETITQLPDTTARMIRHIPRLDEVSDIIRYQRKNYDGKGFPENAIAGDQIPFGSRVLRVVKDLVQLQSTTPDKEALLNTFRYGKGIYYDPQLVDLLESAYGRLPHARTVEHQVRELKVGELQCGYVLTKDVLLKSGMLLVREGVKIKPIHLNRIKNFADSVGVKEPIQVIMSPEDSSED